MTDTETKITCREAEYRRKTQRAELIPAKSFVVLYLLFHVNCILHEFLDTCEVSLTGRHLLQSTATQTHTQGDT